MQPGGVGAVEYSIQMSGYRSYEGAYEVFTSEDCDSSEKAVLVPLYVLKGMGETASSALLLYGAKTQFTAGMPARTAGRTAVGRVAARDTALERAAFEENIALESRLAVKTARREAALAKAAYREELIALESREAIRAARFAPKRGVGVPVSRSANPRSPVLEFDAHGNEIVYRTMSEEHFEILQQTGRLPGTGETSLAPLEVFSRDYDGVLLRLTTKPGTFEQLQEIGIAANKPASIAFPEMSTQTGRWNLTNARFKVEATRRLEINNGLGIMNTQLGRGTALDIFNDNLIYFEKLPK